MTLFIINTAQKPQIKKATKYLKHFTKILQHGKQTSYSKS